MPLYEFRCRDCGSFDRSFTMAEVPAAAECPACSATSRRQPGGAFIRPGSAASRLIDATTRTASEPAVVGAPAAKGAPVTRNPLHHKLPRP